MKYSIVLAALIGTLSSASYAGPGNHILSADDRMAEMEAQLALIRKESEVQEATRSRSCKTLHSETTPSSPKN